MVISDTDKWINLLSDLVLASNVVLVYRPKQSSHLRLVHELSDFYDEKEYFVRKGKEKITLMEDKLSLLVSPWAKVYGTLKITPYLFCIDISQQSILLISLLMFCFFFFWEDI